MQDVTSATAWDLCLWTYRKQKAHRYLYSPYDFMTWALAASGVEDTGSPKVHHDAFQTHAAVSSLKAWKAELLITTALVGVRPEMPTQLPVARPVTPDDPQVRGNKDRVGRHRGPRGVMDYAIRTVGRVLVEEPVYKHHGRGMVEQCGTMLVPSPIEVCPLRWEPPIQIYNADRADYIAWVEGMAEVQETLSRVELRRHRLVPENWTTEGLPEPVEVVEPSAPNVEVFRPKDPELQLRYGNNQDGYETKNVVVHLSTRRRK